ncbi:unnamed protein product [Polarella glacialis]|uniref:Uncharacterized protein n=1 Tax=Polarella glacialis TaxID=89957 RepID=A0A813EL96_POLGL|nr:unnamed protein product [Polarella glacialis]
MWAAAGCHGLPRTVACDACCGSRVWAVPAFLKHGKGCSLSKQGLASGACVDPLIQKIAQLRPGTCCRNISTVTLHGTLARPASRGKGFFRPLRPQLSERQLPPAEPCPLAL